MSELYGQATVLKPVKPARTKQSIALRLTGSGVGFLALMFCAFLISVNFSNNLIFAMTFLLLAIALLAAYHTWNNMRGLKLGEWSCTPVFAGQKVAYHLAVSNDSVGTSHGIYASSKSVSDAKEFHMAKGENCQVSLEFEAPQRGRLASQKTMLLSCFPFGIFRAKRVAGYLPECLVYPSPKGQQALSDKSVGYEAHLREESGSFKDIRRYSPGDSMSHIHWQAFAKFDEVYTKEFDGAEGEPAMYLRWDDVLANGVEEKLSQLCRWVLDLNKQNREYALLMPNCTIEPASGELQLRRCLEALALYGEEEVKNED